VEVCSNQTAIKEEKKTYCIPANDFEEGWLIKSSFITNDKHEASQLRTKFHQKKQKKYLLLYLGYGYFRGME
jgi:hypothetical protein